MSGPYCGSRAQHSADQWGWGMSSPGPAASCQWGDAHFNRWSSRVPRLATFGLRCSLQGLWSFHGWRTVCDPHHITHQSTPPPRARELKKADISFMMFHVTCLHISMRREQQWMCDQLISAVYLMVYMSSFTSPVERNVVLYCQRNSLARSNRMCVCLIEAGIHGIPLSKKLQLGWNLTIVIQEGGSARTHCSPLEVLCPEVPAEAEFVRAPLLRISFVGSSSSLFLSGCVNSPATTRTGESIHQWNFWPTFNIFCFPVWSLLCQDGWLAGWLWLAGQPNWCEYLLVALDSAEPLILLMQAVVPYLTCTASLLSMTQ